MAKNRNDKKELVSQYKKMIESSKGFIIVKPQKLTPNEVNEFRKGIYDFESNFNIIKNSLFELALKDAGVDDLKLDKGENAVMFLGEDIVNPAKVLKKFVEDTKTKDGDLRIVISSGYLEKANITKEQVEELSVMPDKQGSVALILGILDNALSGVVNVLEDAPRSIVTIIDLAYKDKE